MGWFSTDPFTDALLGTFHRRAGAWIAMVEVATLGRVELRLAGDRKAPAPANVALAHSLPAQYGALRDEIGRVLYEHLEPYAAAVAAGEMEADRFDPTGIRGPQDAWAHVTVVRVDVDAARKEYPIEVQLRAAWDEEHTLGVRMRDGALVELCGSV
jgi:hypothetical protein